MTRAALLALLLAVGCAYPGAVRVRGDKGMGWGVVVSRNRVVAPEHCVAGAAPSVKARTGWVRAQKVRLQRRLPEDLVTLEVDAPLPNPARIGRIRKGDSGSPLIDNEGDVIGLLWGYGPHGAIFVIPMEWPE